MKTTIIKPHKSSLGMDANIAALLAYVAMAGVAFLPFIGYLAWAVPLVFFFMEKESKFVKHQAIQAFVIGVVRAALNIVFSIIYWVLTPRDFSSLYSYAVRGGWGLTALVSAVNWIVGLAITVLVVYLVIMAYSYKQVELPVIGDIAAKASEKLNNLNVNQPSQQDKNDTDTQKRQGKQDDSDS